MVPLDKRLPEVLLMPDGEESGKTWHQLTRIDEKTHLSPTGRYRIKGLGYMDRLGARVRKRKWLYFYSSRVFSEMRRRFNCAMEHYSPDVYFHRVKDNVRESLLQLERQVAILEGRLLELAPNFKGYTLKPREEKPMPVEFPRDGQPVLELLRQADKLLAFLEQHGRLVKEKADPEMLKRPVEAAIATLMTDMCDDLRFAKKAPEKEVPALLKPPTDLY